MFFCQLDYNAAQTDKRDEVRDGHETVERVRDIPCKAGAHLAADQGNDDEDHVIGLDTLGRFEDILAAARAIERPAQDRGQCEQGDSQRDDDGAEPVAHDGAEGFGDNGVAALDAVFPADAAGVEGAEDGQNRIPCPLGLNSQ